MENANILCACCAENSKRTVADTQPASRQLRERQLGTLSVLTSAVSVAHDGAVRTREISSGSVWE